MHAHHKDIAILYHGGCPDGFGGAYAAWKKFGDDAEYIPVKRGVPPPAGLENRTVYLIDFCYAKEPMEELRATAKEVIVLDHHEGIREVATSFPGVFDAKHSGATIAWTYFHPDTPVPTLLNYVEDGDLYVFRLPDSHAILAYAYAQTFHFDTWDALSTQLDSETERATIIEKGNIYAEHLTILVKQIAEKACLASFEGFECYVASAPGMFASDVGNLLVRTKPPLGVVTSLYGESLRISLRSDDSLDVSALARKYGGNGHPKSAAFIVKWGDPLPWTVLHDNENTGD